MIASLAYLFLGGLLMAAVCQKIKLPRIVGMLVTGIVLGPYALNVLDPSLLNISASLREIALIVILVKAGLSLNVKDLKAVGRPAVLLSFLPASFEILGFVLFAPAVLHVTRAEAAIMGAVLGAVSPAVVVPRMVRLMEDKLGTEKRIPQMLLAGASLDDVFVIVLFTAFLGLAQGQAVSLAAFAEIPVSMITGVLLGVLAGLALHLLFRGGRIAPRGLQAVIVLATAFLLTAAEDMLADVVPLSGLLAVMSMACALQMKASAEETYGLSKRFGELWLAAEVLLFVLVGAAVDVRYTLTAGGQAVLLMLAALVFRAGGVWLSLLGTNLNRREKLFCVIAYLPKATVQAAIGGVPLAMGLPCGRMVLSVAVLSILLTAPLGALGMDRTCHRLLEKEK